MKERPILFSGPMVRAILDGSKTQTRRVVKPQFERGPVDVVDGVPSWDAPTNYGGEVQMNTTYGKPCPHGVPGDQLWVREAWRGVVEINPPGKSMELGVARYVPDQEYCRRVEYQATQGRDSEPWRPSIHMPRWASRITLEITGVRVERLHDISEADAEAEGVDFLRHVPDADETLSARDLFKCLWSGINGDDSWDANPWVWVEQFKRA